MLTKLALTGDLGCSKVNGNMRNLGCRMMDSRSRARMTLMSQAGKPGGTLGRGSAGRSASAELYSRMVRRSGRLDLAIE